MVHVCSVIVKTTSFRVGWSVDIPLHHKLVVCRSAAKCTTQGDGVVGAPAHWLQGQSAQFSVSQGNST